MNWRKEGMFWECDNSHYWIGTTLHGGYVLHEQGQPKEWFWTLEEAQQEVEMRQGKENQCHSTH